MRRIVLDGLIVGTVLFFVLFVFIRPVSAVIYKWKDESGKIFFTDDLSKIPSQHRFKPTVEIVRGTSEPPQKPPESDETKKEGKEKKTTAKVTGDEGARKAEEKRRAEKKKAEVEKKMEAEKPDLQAVIAHLENEIKRDERVITILPTMVNGKYMVADIQALLPAKKAVAEKIEKATSPVLKATHEFLATSIEQDEKERISVDQGMQTRIYALLDRMKAELPVARQLLDQVKSELGRIEQALAAAEPLSPVVEEAPKVEALEEKTAEDKGEKLPEEGESKSLRE